MRIGRKKRATWEVWAVSLLVTAAVVLAAGIYANRDQIEKERLLTLELTEMRNYVMVYALQHRQFPSSLIDLSDRHAKQNFPRAATRPKGPVEDPFGHPYLYHSKTGRITSSSKNYGSW